MEKFIEKAHTLLEALPYIKNFYGKTLVVKYGGSAMVKDELKRAFAEDITLLKYIGINPVVVHGGGPQIGEVMEKMGLESRFYRGMRVTDDATMDVVEMVLMGKVNKEIVNLINRAGGKAVGLSGKDGNMIFARKITFVEEKEGLPPEIIDIGKVGEVTEFNPEILRLLESSRFVPVIAPVGVDKEGDTFNLNADIVAAEIAIGLEAEKLIFLTDAEGVKGKDNELIKSLSAGEALDLIKKEIINGGMIPKIEWSVKTVKNGVGKVHIIDGRIPHSLILELFTDAGIGTEIVR